MRYSHTAIKTFEQCPRQFEAKYILRTYKEPPSVHATWGVAVHSHVEKNLKEGIELPKELSNLAPLLSIIKKYPGTLLVEHRIAVSSTLKPVAYNSNDAWLIGIVDLIKVTEDKALLCDWKTGKIRDDFSQLEISSLLLMASYPNLQSVLAMFIWRKYGSISKQIYTKENKQDMWAKLIKKIDRIETAISTNNFQPKPSWLCRYCYLKTCEFCKT